MTKESLTFYSEVDNRNKAMLDKYKDATAKVEQAKKNVNQTNRDMDEEAMFDDLAMAAIDHASDRYRYQEAKVQESLVEVQKFARLYSQELAQNAFTLAYLDGVNIQLDDDLQEGDQLPMADAETVLVQKN